MTHVTHYDNIENPKKEQIIDLMEQYDERFSDFKMKVSDIAKDNLFTGNQTPDIDAREAIKLLYESDFNHIVLSVEEETGDVLGIKIVDTMSETDDILINNAPKYYPCMRYTYELIREEYRNQGIYTELLEYTEKKLLPKHDDHNHAAYFLTAEDNKAMREAGKSNGFELVSIVENDRENYKDTHIYVKEYEEYRRSPEQAKQQMTQEEIEIWEEAATNT